MTQPALYVPQRQWHMRISPLIQRALWDIGWRWRRRSAERLSGLPARAQCRVLGWSPALGFSEQAAAMTQQHSHPQCFAVGAVEQAALVTAEAIISLALSQLVAGHRLPWRQR